MSKSYEEKILTTQKDAGDSFLTDGIDALSNRLDELRGNLSYKVFAEMVGMSESGMRKYFPPFNSLPTIDKALRIARVFNVNLEWLTTGQGPRHPDGNAELMVQRDAFDEEYALIDGFHIAVSAGHGAFNDQHEVKRKLAFRRKWLKFRQLQPENLAVVFAQGDSMEPTIHTGDSILIDTSKNQIKDGGLFVLRLGDELYAKRLQKRVDGGVNIISDNRAGYETLAVLPNELDSLSIIGKVVWLGHDFF
ncbi:helix-turn-helix transcriptional regulator [Aeromonas sp. MR16]|uniref:helix-turn-helix transcriptional regulator n=1 Tax=Aeromonas sp. MR16 TaxID=2923420 RepID=UPI001F4BA0C1|nr:helix-turn-helix transcriptional regulator [Aeromonas sp. MR16]MCH7371061.1 helix-turn-helix transcriptional regulator [Aeromonas sp. MR16]